MRKPLLVAGALSLALVLGACGGEEDDTSKGTGTAATSASSQPDGGTAGDAASMFDAVKQGTQSAKSAKFSMEIVGGQQGAQQGGGGSGEAIFDGADTKISMTMQGGGQEMELRMIGTDVYLKGMPGADQSKPWVKMSFESIPGFKEQMENSDPTKMIENMKAAGAELTGQKKAQLDGQPVTHYSFEVDLQKMTERMTGQKAGGPAGQKKMPIDIYLNADNLPVQIDVDMGQGKLRTKYTDWGTPVKIETPPESEVGEMPKQQQPQPGQTQPN